MVDSSLSTRSKGFSLVEMMVALVFVMVLMAGMASVFKTSLSTFFTSGEALSSNRRNRLSIDLLVADLDTANMYLSNLSTPPNFGSNPPFCVLPNMQVTGDPNLATSYCDELYFYLDQAPSFDGTLSSAITEQSAGQLVAAGPTNQALSNTQFSIECGNAFNASLVTAGQEVFFKDSGEVAFLTAVGAPSDGQVHNSLVKVTLGLDPNAGLVGTGAVGFGKTSHIGSSAVVFFQPAQVVKYSVQLIKLDTDPNGPLVPCLVRDQGAYSAQAPGYANFQTNQPQQIITENVQGFKVYLSVSSPTPAAPNTPQAWAGLWAVPPNANQTGFTGWTSGLLGNDPASISTQMSAVVPNATLPANNPNWFRSVPTLVRFDVTTRTATQRTEYSPNPTTPTVAYKLQTQSIVIVPRHSGLPMDWT
jgi:Flp pilus assembly pilin Flp